MSLTSRWNDGDPAKLRIEGGIRPGNLPPEKDVEKLERRVVVEAKKMLKGVKKLKKKTDSDA